MKKRYYQPTGTMEDYDGKHFYNAFGQKLKDPEEFTEIFGYEYYDDY